MMPAALVYALSDRQRTAVNRAHAARKEGRAAPGHDEIPVPTPTFPRRRVRRLPGTRECIS